MMTRGRAKYLSMALASILNFFMPVSVAINPNCDFYQDLIMGQEYYIYNQEYPGSYGPSASCRWVAHSEPGTRIIISCENINIPSSPNCNGDRLSISLTGNENLADSRNYCGVGSVTLATAGNSLAVGLFSTSGTKGGKFICTITAIQDTTAVTTEAPPSPCDCGWKQGTRIVGGVETGIHEFPGNGRTRRSPAEDSLLWGHNNIQQIHINSGALRLKKGRFQRRHPRWRPRRADTPTAQIYTVSAFEMHPEFNQQSLLNDIAIVQTTREIAFSLYVGPACLPFRYTTLDFGGQTVTALGWGQLEFSGPSSDTLQKVNLTVVPNAECAPQQTNPVTRNQICTYAEGKDACTMDSGGPLFWMDTSTQRLQLVGIISFGLGCATQRPGVNTRVSSYISWIVSRTSDAKYCIK
ncbi:hypothetical protein NQ317_019080 [Molorchus minor]|uniref:Venom serine protease 34 n=1 Tax=Molorchus minor TaxID=1323400 RepID=A0ABQ9JMI8_9CUCU|nr:hypothetical protein NQ317_019080 [Molorchus minor]